MKQPAHMIMISPWRGLGFGERLAIEGASALLWPLQPDDRMTVLLTLLADQIFEIATNEDQIDAIVDVLRMQLKLKMMDSPPLQAR
jgi:hypothetical protein